LDNFKNTLDHTRLIKMSNVKKLLSCWHKLEHFSPSSLPKSKNVIPINPTDLLPWNILSLQLEKEKVIINTVYLGVFNVVEVVDFTYNFFKEKNNEQNIKDENIVFASIKVDQEGRYIHDTLGVSMLPWALGQLEKKKITSDSWNSDFQKMLDDLKEALNPVFYETVEEEYEEESELQRQAKTLSIEDLHNIQRLVEKHCGWSISPETSFCYQQKKRNRSASEKREGKLKESVDILNSFYVKDLENIINSLDKLAPDSALSDYLKGSLKEPTEKFDLNQNTDTLKKALQPMEFPEGCWPSSYSLNLMQQFAVNTIVGKTTTASTDEKLFSVNGPPGTGKTTLLRHAIAGILVESAKKLAAYKNPEDAFTKVKSFKSEWKTFDSYQPDEAITKGGISIASSNNGAVENITKELPLAKEVKPYENAIAYFRDALPKGEEPCWGVLSATLGNMKNRKKCKSDLWYYFDDNKQKMISGLQSYLKTHTPKDLESWKAMVLKFNAKQQEVIVEKERLQHIANNASTIEETKEAFRQMQHELEDQELEISKLKQELKKNECEQNRLKEEKERIFSELQLLKSSKPNFFTYWLNPEIRRSYNKNLSSIFEQRLETEEALNTIKKTIKAQETTLQNIENALIATKNKSIAHSRVIEDIESAKKELDSNFADKEYWDSIASKKVQNSCPWYSKALQQLQTELFIISLELQETFILTANRKDNQIIKTLGGCFEFITGHSSANKETIMAMWNTFLLVVPVVSTTFASFDRMFDKVPAGKLPWLFIDEAGQSVPQAAAGGIWRSEKVVVVGDPLQIEPVNTIPRILTEKLREHFDLDHHQVSPELSVQTVADNANKYGTYLNDASGDAIWIGSPLRIHRRCVDPMFSIANSIAYTNSMFLATPPPKRVNISFDTQFIHCEGQVSGRHFCEQHAIIVKEIIQQEISRMRLLPKLFVISPFKEVSDNLKTYLKKNISYSSGVMTPQQDKFRLGQWIEKSTGTVHTFQGKQAEGVIMCLGLDERTKGAASWASCKPNILNVALTRAKYKFIAIGDECIWLEQPFFKQLKALERSVVG